MDISRRTVLTGVGSLGLAAAIGQALAPIAAAAPPHTTGDWEELRQRWIDLLTGRTLIDAGSPVFTAALATLNADLATTLAGVVADPARSRIFTDLDPANDGAMNVSFNRLALLARGWATPGSSAFGSQRVLDVVLAGLRDLHRLAYHAGRAETGNWWSWEIGSSRSLADTMAIVRDHLTDTEIANYCAAIDHFVPDPWTQFRPPRAVVASTGANRVDLCQAVIIRSLITGDTARMQRAVEGLSATWQYVTSGDGFFRDGSFVQHSTIGYTGTYGLVLLGGLSKLFALLAGSSQAVTDPSRSIIDQAVESSYASLIYRGQMMDAVRGRAISRTAERSFTDGDLAIESILRLALAVDPAMAARWRGLCRQWIDAARSGSARHDILERASLVRTALVNQLLTSPVPARADVGNGRLFPGMDRLVHRGRNNAWAMTVAMCSNRIAWYECGNGENNLAAQTSSGMTYLYLDSSDHHFDDDFWPTCDLAAPPGTTVDLTPLPPKVEGEWGSRTPKNEWTGGSVLEGYSLAGQHLIAPGGTGMSARKTWFATTDAVVCLGSDITCTPQSTTHQVTTSADAHVNDGARATTNAGSATNLLVKTVSAADTGYTRQTYLQFSPAAVSGHLDAITLNLHARVNDGGGTTETVMVHRTTAFDESTLTWRNKPAVGETLGTVEITNTFSWRQVDLTESLRAAVAAGETISLVITEDLPPGRAQGLSVEIKSKESGSTAPYLQIGVSVPGEGRTKSVVEHRNSGAAPLLIDDRTLALGDSLRVENPRWAHLEGTGGYVFLTPGVVRASKLERTGSWNRISTGGPTTVITRTYATVEVLHPESGRATYAYVVAPKASRATTQAWAAKPPVSVEANTAQVQAATWGKVTAANFWVAGSVAGMRVDGPASVLARRTPGMAAVAISDPTQQASMLVIEFANAPWTRVKGSGVSMTRRGSTVRVTVAVSGRGGVPVEFTLHRG